MEDFTERIDIFGHVHAVNIEKNNGWVYTTCPQMAREIQKKLKGKLIGQYFTTSWRLIAWQYKINNHKIREAKRMLGFLK